MSSGLELMQLALRHRRSTMPTTVAAIDELLGGGLPRGSLVELSARRSAGRFSIVLSTLAAATSAGEAAALIDLGDHLDPQELDDAGAELSRVLWIRPKTTKEAVMSAELLVTTGFPLVVVDLGLRPRGAKVADASWIRLARLAETHATALLVSSPWPLCGTAAAVSLSIPDRRVSWHGTGGAPRLITAIAARITLLRSKGQHLDVREGRTAAMVIRNVESIAIREEKTAGATDSRRGGVGSANAIPRHASHPEDAPAIVRHTPDAGDIPVFVRPAPHAGDAPVTVRHAPDAGDAPAIVRHASHAGGVPEGSRGSPQATPGKTIPPMSAPRRGARGSPCLRPI